jgi:hypothetical protein
LNKPIKLEKYEDIELLFEILDEDKDKKLTDEKLRKEFNKRKVKKYAK